MYLATESSPACCCDLIDWLLSNKLHIQSWKLEQIDTDPAIIYCRENSDISNNAAGFSHELMHLQIQWTFYC